MLTHVPAMGSSPHLIDVSGYFMTRGAVSCHRRRLLGGRGIARRRRGAATGFRLFARVAETIAILGALLHQYLGANLHTLIADIAVRAFEQLGNLAVVPPAKRATILPALAEQTLV
jgi:hypothetical protein